MTEAIIVGLIAAGASIATTLITASKQAAVTDERLKTVEKKLDIHNGYAEKFTDIQVDIAEIKTEIKNIKETKS